MKMFVKVCLIVLLFAAACGQSGKVEYYDQEVIQENPWNTLECQSQCSLQDHLLDVRDCADTQYCAVITEETEVCGFPVNRCLEGCLVVDGVDTCGVGFVCASGKCAKKPEVVEPTYLDVKCCYPGDLTGVYMQLSFSVSTDTQLFAWDAKRDRVFDEDDGYCASAKVSLEDYNAGFFVDTTVGLAELNQWRGVEFVPDACYVDGHPMPIGAFVDKRGHSFYDLYVKPEEPTSPPEVLSEIKCCYEETEYLDQYYGQFSWSESTDVNPEGWGAARDRELWFADGLGCYSALVDMDKVLGWQFFADLTKDKAENDVWVGTALRPQVCYIDEEPAYVGAFVTNRGWEFMPLETKVMALLTNYLRANPF